MDGENNDSTVVQIHTLSYLVFFFTYYYFQLLLTGLLFQVILGQVWTQKRTLNIPHAVLSPNNVIALKDLHTLQVLYIHCK